MSEKGPASGAPFKKERELYHKRWQAQADAMNEMLRQHSGFAIPNEDLVTGYDMMRQEAELDYEALEKRRHIEYQENAKRVRQVYKNFKERATNPKSKRRTLIYVASGGMLAALSAGQLATLNTLGITADKVDVVVGASSGGMAATSYVGGVEATKVGFKMQSGPLASKDFIDTDISRAGNMVNLGMVRKLLGEGEYKLDQDAIRKSKTELAYVVTLPVTGNDDPEAAFLDAKTLPDMRDGIVATMSIPYVTGDIPEIYGLKFLDGGFDPLPLKKLIETFEPTDILILTQGPFVPKKEVKPSTSQTVAAATARAFGLQQLAKALLIKERWRKGADQVEKDTNVNIAFLYSPHPGITQTTVDGSDLKASFLAAGYDAFGQFGEQPREGLMEYISSDDEDHMPHGAERQAPEMGATM